MIRTLVTAVAFTLGLTALVSPPSAGANDRGRLTPPETGKIRVAFLVSPGATVIDFAGPWEVFQDVMIPGRGDSRSDAVPFELYTVAETADPVRATGGLHIVPDYTIENAPQPHVIVVPAMRGSDAVHAWLRRASEGADLTMSVCTGAFQLARAGLLDGRMATTHHDFYDQLERSFPAIEVVRDVRFVEGDRFASAGGLTSGIDLALRVVARYFGEQAAARTASYMEHASEGWRADAGVWDAGAKREPRSQVAPPVLRGLDPVLLAGGKETKGRTDLTATRGRVVYAFANEKTRATFLADPERYEIQFEGRCGSMAASGATPWSGDVNRFHVHDGRIYIFASDQCRETFKADPARYVTAAK